jgi:hypothetical protein
MSQDRHVLGDLLPLQLSVPMCDLGGFFHESNGRPLSSCSQKNIRMNIIAALNQSLGGTEHS